MANILRSMILPCLALLWWPCASAHAQGGVTFAHPSAGPTGNTQFFAVSNGKAAGAWYNPQSNASGAFLYDIATGSATPLQFPGSSETPYPFGIAGNYITGYHYRLTAAGEFQGFLHDGVNWTGFDVPVPAGAGVNTYAYDVRDDGTVVGQFDSQGVARGFVRTPSGDFTTLHYPGSLNTSAAGIDGNRIVGTYQEEVSVSRGFLYEGGTWTPINYPGATITFPRDIDGDLIVGDFYEGQFGFGRNRGFLYDIPSGTWTPFNVPGDNFTTVSGVDGDTIVGWFDVVGDEGGARAFIATVPEPGIVSMLAVAGLIYMPRGRRGR